MSAQKPEGLAMRLLDRIAAVALIAASSYFLVALLVFALRHPWMTTTEQWLHVWDAMTWSTVDYDTARPRGAR